ncbi:AAA family ATPase [Cognatiyoonia sp. IB215446]|uniref:AAA family ATPase n=1 Tax=Cognatiyoonia sp. IB215446 TaxID=3097355 RepID=UPI002A144FA5|nr:AAA family ATPase [Cognatiyoonia sp. IB215446]MDX8350610.1 AAA family ATPase [Cognatiyoonia sp. IB215446]
MKDIGLRVRDADAQADRPEGAAVGGATTLGDVLAVLRRQWLPLVLLTLLGLMAGAVHHVTTPKQYYVAATVLVDERPVALDQEITASIPFARNDTSLLNEMQVLRSLQLATEVARRLDLHNEDVFIFPPSSLARDIISGTKGTLTGLISSDAAEETQVASDPAADEARRLRGAAAKLQRDIRISRIGMSFSIEISYIGHDPALAADVVNTYATAYLDDGLNANVESTERTTAWMRNRLAELEETSAAVLAEAAAMRRTEPENVMELRELAQRAATLDALYQTLSARYAQMSLQGSFPVSNGRILTESLVPRTAALPKLWRTLSVMGLLGLMAGFLLAVLREMRERGFRVSSDIHTHTDHAFLGHLPQIEPKSAASGTPQRQVPTQFLWAVDMPQSTFAETLRNIHATVALGATDGLGRVLAVTSMLPGEGATTLAVNYANMLAASGARTMLIDLGATDAGLREALNLPGSAGLIDVLHSKAQVSDALQRLDATGLDILPAGTGRRQPVAADIVYQRHLRALVQELRNHYDHIVLDTPALGTTADVKAMLGLLDRIVLVCEWGQTPRSLVTRYLAQEPDVSQKVLGIALNKVNMAKLARYARPGWPESYLQPNAHNA